EKKDFYRLDFWEYYHWIYAWEDQVEEEVPKRFFHLEFSPDSRLLVASRSHHFRASYTVDFIAVAGTDDTLLALDLTTVKPINVAAGLKKLARRPFLFLDANRILAMSPEKLEAGGVFSFPDGKRLARFPIAGRELQRTLNPNYVIIKPMADAKLGIFNLSTSAIVGKLDKPDAAIWNNLEVHESVNGSVVLSEITYDEKSAELQTKTIGTVEVPVGSIGRPEAADISDNLEWLAVSSKTRGAMWNLKTGDRKMYVRGFRGAVIADSGNWIGDFPDYETIKHSLVVLNPKTNEANNLREMPEKGAKQFRRFLLVRAKMKPDEKAAKTSVNKSESEREAEAEKSLAQNVRFELNDLLSNKTVWSAEFPKEAPLFFFDEFSGRLILYWKLDNDRARAQLKDDPALATRARELGNKDDDYLVKIVDCYVGKTIGTLLLETGKGSFGIQAGFSEGDWLVLRDDENRVLAYSIKDGTLHHRFFGSNAAINLLKNQIAVENYPGEITFYDLSTGDSRSRVSFPNRAAFMRYSLDGKQLFVLSGEQTAYLFDVAKLQAKPVAAAQ
ncbi:MAG TPA: hypothetical protein VGC61_09945, partial [Pyrinomonadaceae bacterium]